MKGYKGFDKDFKCIEFQYEVGQTYEEKTAKVCNSGFHYCHNPLDVLDYYPIIDSYGELNQFAEVEPLDSELTDDNKKYCTKKIKIGAKLDLKGLIKASIDFIFENCKEQKNELTQASSGYYAQLASSGYSAKLASSGDFAQLASSGDSAKLASSGYSAIINSMGEKAVVANIGINGKTKAKLGSFITLAEYEYVDGHYVPIAVKSHKVDGKTVKADTWYTLKNGKFVVAKK